MIEIDPTQPTVITAEKFTTHPEVTQAAGTYVHQSHLPYGTIPIFLMISISTTNSNTS
jgi:hypothetical protein